MFIFIQNSVIIVIQSGGHSDQLMANIMQGVAIQKLSQDNLLSLMMLLDSLAESVGTSEVEPSSLLIRESASSSRMLNTFTMLSRLELVKYQRGT